MILSYSHDGYMHTGGLHSDSVRKIEFKSFHLCEIRYSVWIEWFLYLKNTGLCNIISKFLLIAKKIIKLKWATWKKKYWFKFGIN